MKIDDPKVDIRLIKMKTKMEMGVMSWVLKPIFGMDESNSTKTININSFKNECIMCCDEGTDVMMYPCRHLSIGFKCAQSIRASKKCNECPVCRSNIERFIKINL